MHLACGKVPLRVWGTVGKPRGNCKRDCRQVGLRSLVKKQNKVALLLFTLTFLNVLMKYIEYDRGTTDTLESFLPFSQFLYIQYVLHKGLHICTRLHARSGNLQVTLTKRARMRTRACHLKTTMTSLLPGFFSVLGKNY